MRILKTSRYKTTVFLYRAHKHDGVQTTQTQTQTYIVTILSTNSSLIMPKAKKKKPQRGGSIVSPVEDSRVFEKPPVKNVQKKHGLAKFDMLALPNIQTQVVDTVSQVIRPQQAVAGDSSVVTFKIEGNDYFFDIHETEMVLQLKYVAADGTALANSIVANREGFRHSLMEGDFANVLWSNVEIRINDEDIKSHIFSYSIMSYVKNLISTTKAEQELLAETCYWEKESNFDVNWSPNNGHAVYDEFKGRLLRTVKMGKATHTFWVRSKIHHAMMEQPKCIPPRNDVTLTFSKAKAETYLNSWAAAGTAPKVVIEKMELLIRRQKLNPEDQKRIESILLKTPAAFPLKDRVELRYHNIPQNTSNYTANALFNGKSPSLVLAFFIKGDNFLGQYNRSQRNFEHCNVTDIWFEKNSKHVPSTGYLKLNMHDNPVQSGSALYAYQCFKDLGKRFSPAKVLNVSYKEFCSGYTIFAFDFTCEKEMNDEGSFSTVNTAPITLNVDFSEATAQAINCVLYNLYDDCLYIDGNKRVTTTFMS